MLRQISAYGSILVIAFVFYMFFTAPPKVEVVPLPEPEPIMLELPHKVGTIETPPVPEPEEVFYNEREIECLALNSYYESRGESRAGQVAVAQVVLNRLESERFPNTICGVVQQGPTYKNWKGNILPV